jgi:hypothetical protein
MSNRKSRAHCFRRHNKQQHWYERFLGCDGVTFDIFHNLLKFKNQLDHLWMRLSERGKRGIESNENTEQ